MKNKMSLNFKKMKMKFSVKKNFFEIFEVFMISIAKISKKIIDEVVKTFQKYEFVFLISINEDDSFIDVNVINVAVFSRLIKKKNHNLKVFNLKNVKKTLNIKFKSNFVTLI